LFPPEVVINQYNKKCVFVNINKNKKELALGQLRHW